MFSPAEARYFVSTERDTDTSYLMLTHACRSSNKQLHNIAVRVLCRLCSCSAECRVERRDGASLSKLTAVRLAFIPLRRAAIARNEIPKGVLPASWRTRTTFVCFDAAWTRTAVRLPPRFGAASWRGTRQPRERSAPQSFDMYNSSSTSSHQVCLPFGLHVGSNELI